MHSLTSNSFSNGYIASRGPSARPYTAVPIFQPQNIAAGLPPISWIIYTHNHYGALHNPPILSHPQNIRVSQHESDNNRRQAVVTPLPPSAPEPHVMTSGRMNADSTFDSSQVARKQHTTVSQPVAGPKKVRWALGPTGHHTNNNRPQRSILRAGSSKNVMTVPFTVSFRLNSEEYTVEFEPVNWRKQFQMASSLIFARRWRWDINCAFSD
jgi:hypothetical protein